MKIFTAIKQRFCRHKWQITKFQALVPGTSYECTKCGKQQRFYYATPTSKGESDGER